MKRYLRNLALMLFLLSLVTGIFFGSLYLALHKTSFKVDDSINILVVGDSHTECAIDDKILSRSANFSKSGTHMYFSYLKVKNILRDNPQIDTVLVSFFPDQISKDKDQEMLSEMKGLSQLILYVDWRDLIPEIKLKSISRMTKFPLYSVPIVFKKISRGKVTVHDLYIGRYDRLDRNKLQEHIRRKAHSEKEAIIETDSKQYEYLSKIIKICDNRNVKLILLNSPVYQGFNYYNIAKFDSLRTVIFPDIDYLDYSAFPLPDSCFGDITHLNFKGAEIFSEYLQENGLVSMHSH